MASKWLPQVEGTSLKMTLKMNAFKKILTRTFAAKALDGPRIASVFRATSAAACSACLRVEQKFGLSKVSPLKLTVALKRGA